MGECTLRTDFIPGVGPSSDQLYPVELRPSYRASEADCHGLWREEVEGGVQPNLGFTSLSCRAPGTPETGFCGLASSGGGRRARGRVGRGRGAGSVVSWSAEGGRGEARGYVAAVGDTGEAVV